MTVSDDQASRWAADVALVRAVLDGDRDARTRFASRMECIARILSALNARVGRPLGPEDLADLSQDTLVAIWQKLETYEGKATLESWTWSFCQHEFLNRVRKHQRRGAVTGTSLEQVEEGPATPQPAPALEYDHLEGGLVALGEPGESIIRLKHFQHLKFTEIAERLGVPINTVKTRYYRGMSWLKAHLERRGEGGDPA